MKADAQTESAVMATLNQLAEGYATRELERVMSVFAPDPVVLVYGTGADEKRVGLDEIRMQVQRDWSQAESTSLTYDWTLVSAAGDVAWVAADATFHVRAGEQAMSLPARLTMVLQKRADRWLVMQGHFSFPAQGQSEGESFPT